MSFSVAIVGPDGSGKTTVAKRLLQAYPAPMKYVYMGAALQSANVTLWTSRWLLRLKKKSYDKAVREGRHVESGGASPHNVEFTKVQTSTIARDLALANLIAEEWYRQLVSWIYRIRGYVVLFDRHVVFEYVPDSTTYHVKNYRLGIRLHLWLVRRCFPRPDLTVLLDAPPEVMYERKREWSIEHLRRHRSGLIEQGEKTSNFVRVDATKDIDQVVQDVLNRMLEFQKGGA